MKTKDKEKLNKEKENSSTKEEKLFTLTSSENIRAKVLVGKIRKVRKIFRKHFFASLTRLIFCVCLFVTRICQDL